MDMSEKIESGDGGSNIPRPQDDDDPVQYEAGVLARVLAEDDRPFFGTAMRAASKIFWRLP